MTAVIPADRKPGSSGVDAFRWIVLLIGFCLAGTRGQAAVYGITDYDEVESSSTSPGWTSPPGNHHSLYLDVYNVTDYYDLETTNSAGLVAGTFFADTVRPTATILWDKRFRIQLGLIALRGYGDSEGFRSVDPWIQLLWKPIDPVSIYFGNLKIPHYYHQALFYPLNYVRGDTNETGVQVTHERTNWFDDLYFNYRLQDTPEHREKFDLGFVHRNAFLEFVRFNYESHWIHEGGELNSHDIHTINDVAQTIGGGLHWNVTENWGIGGKFNYLVSHYRADATDPALKSIHNGSGDLYEIYGRWKRLKLIAQSWFGHEYQHEGGDPMYTTPRMHVLSARWDVMLSRDFSVLTEATGYFVGTNSQGIDQTMKAAIHVQAVWQFSIPIVEWTTPSASPEGQPIPPRWDDGI